MTPASVIDVQVANSQHGPNRPIIKINIKQANMLKQGHVRYIGQAKRPDTRRFLATGLWIASGTYIPVYKADPVIEMR